MPIENSQTGDKKIALSTHIPWQLVLFASDTEGNKEPL